MPVSKRKPGRKFSKKQVKDRMSRKSKMNAINRGYNKIINFIDSRVTA